jgi:dihydrofolate reductase
MKAIVAVDRNWGIGLKGKLLAQIPADQRFFRETTTGHVVVMGRKTLESFPGQKPLKNRRNIVLTRQEDYAGEDFTAVTSVEQALELVKGLDPDDVFCIGGAEIYRLFLPYCDRALITRIDHIYEADAFFPDLDKDPAWNLVKESEEQIYFDLTYHFCIYEKRKEKLL